MVSWCSEEADADADADGLRKASEGWEEGEEDEDEGGSRRAWREARRAALRVWVERRARLRDLVACNFRRSWRIDSGVGAEAGAGRMRFCSRWMELGQPTILIIGGVETSSRFSVFPSPPPPTRSLLVGDGEEKEEKKHQRTS